MSRILAACALAGTVALSVTVAAQNPPAAPQNQAPTQPPATAPQSPAPTQPAATAQQTRAGAVTIEGCLVREADVPGRKPNLVERQGIMEDYILTSTTIVIGSASSAVTPPADQPTGTAGTTAMYHVKGMNDERLKPLVGKRVQIEGNLQDLDRAAPASEDLPDIQADNIRQVSGDCPAARP
jgi:hypothetical protein